MMAHGCCRGSDSFRILISHRCGTQVSLSALFMAYLISAMSTTKLYSLMVSASMVSCLHISISLDALVVSQAFLVSASVPHQCVHTVSVTMWSTLGCHWSAGWNPFKFASNSARFLYLASFFSWSQQASSMSLLASRATLMANELASTQTWIHSHQRTNLLVLDHPESLQPRFWSACFSG